MPKRSGRPPKKEAQNLDHKQRIIDTAIQIIKSKGADAVTVRNVCAAADIGTGTFYYHFKNKDDLLIYFLKETSFDSYELKASINQITERIAELYMHLIHRYMDLGLDFMKSFYTTGNRALSAYMGEVEGRFEPDTVMARCEKELLAARGQGVLHEKTDVHLLSKDICTIVKGCIFEWCLAEGDMDIEGSLYRIIRNSMTPYL